ncbi:MAG: helix-turn-helix domain-containing protein [Coprobacillaceae bacterium]
MIEDYCTMEDVQEYIAQRIRQLRELKGNIPAQTLSIELGQNNSYIHKIENKQAKPSLDGLFYICDYFGITLKEFFAADINPYPTLINDLVEKSQTLNQEELELILELVKVLNDKNNG